MQQRQAARRLFWNGVVPLAVLMALLGAGLLVQFRQAATGLVKDGLLANVSRRAAEIDGKFLQASQVAKTTADLMQVFPDITPDQLYAVLRRDVAANPFVYGAALAFEPGQYQGRRIYSPYVFRDATNGNNLKAIDIAAESYDYTLAQWEWYNLPKTLQKAVWTAPYFDEGAGNILMVTYSAPFQRSGRFWGVATVDVPVKGLQLDADGAPPLTGDQILLTNDGIIAIWPTPGLEGNTVFSITARSQRDDLAAIGRSMLAGERRVVTVSGWDSGGNQLVAFAPMPSSGWSYGVRVNEMDAFADVNRQVILGAVAVAVVTALALAAGWFGANWLAKAD